VGLLSLSDAAGKKAACCGILNTSSVSRTMDRKAHWQRIYTTKATDAVSWFQPAPTVATQLLNAAGLTTYT
jgi:hypothetical protein